MSQAYLRAERREHVGVSRRLGWFGSHNSIIAEQANNVKA